MTIKNITNVHLDYSDFDQQIAEAMAVDYDEDLEPLVAACLEFLDVYGPDRPEGENEATIRHFLIDQLNPAAA